MLLLILGSSMPVDASILANTPGEFVHWYEGSVFDIIPDDGWLPFYALTDIPYSLPLRGFVGSNRNYFLDLGALDWLSDWIEFYYHWEVNDFEVGIHYDDLDGQLAYLFETTTDRLSKPQSNVDIDRNYSAVDYVRFLEPPYEVFIPLIVMYGLNETYDEEGIKEWVIHQEVVEDALNEAFPLITWETELYWFGYDEVPSFAELMDEKLGDEGILIDDDYLTRCDEIIHGIISENPKYASHDFVLPALIMLQDYTLFSEGYGMAVGGLGRLSSAYPEVNSWCLNGRNVYSYFFAGDPDRPRTSITSTVIHELGHCVGQTDIHSTYGWFAAASSMSVMCAYQQPACFDRFDMDLILNGQALQLWGKYIDEIAYLRGFSLTSSQQSELNALEMSLRQTPYLLVESNAAGLKALFYQAQTILDQVSSETAHSRKTDNWSEEAPALDIQIDWIIGPGLPDSGGVRDELQSTLEAVREITLFTNTTLPAPRYNASISVHATDDEYNELMYSYWRSQLAESQTSNFNEDRLPSDAFISWPRDNIFQVQAGYALEGSLADQWLVDNPYTAGVESKIHYRFYIFNMADMEIPPSGYEDPIAVLVGGGLCVALGVIAIVALRRRRSLSSQPD
ncbi:MAG: hypothetical protein EAX95_04575 [Candidatus Thorarchaeota archaeon]|nr:hypothetical protein [Candidatus Thorarchaeota archaeon]